MKRTLGILFIVGALALGYFGFTRMQDSSAEIKIGDLELSAQDGSSKQESYLLFGMAVVCLVVGLALSRSKD